MHNGICKIFIISFLLNQQIFNLIKSQMHEFTQMLHNLSRSLSPSCKTQHIINAAINNLQFCLFIAWTSKIVHSLKLHLLSANLQPVFVKNIPHTSKTFRLFDT